MENPIEFGRELATDELVNRVDEQEILSQAIRTGSKLFVVGPRRFGKTSLLKSASENSEKRGHVILRCNAESFSDLEGLVRKIIEESGRGLKGPVEKIGEQLKRYFRSLRPEVSFSVKQTAWKGSLGVVPSDQAAQLGLLVDTLDGLEKLAADLPSNKKAALIVDEFQEVINIGGVTAEKQIRSAIQTHRHIAYIFAGSQTSMLTDMITDPGRPFYRLGAMLFVGPLPRPEFSRFLIDKFAAGDFFEPGTPVSQSSEIALRILDLAEDVPYNVQMLSHALWNVLALREGSPEKGRLTMEVIDETLEQLLRQHDPFYTQVWNKLTPIQRKSLSATANEKGTGLLSAQVIRSIGVGSSSLQRALESLVQKDILRTREDKGKITYLFQDPFFGHWIRMFTY